MSDTSILSTKQLIISSIAALVIGVLLTLFIVLPAERGSDPTGFGEATGLSELASEERSADTTTVVVDANALYISVDPATAEIPLDDWERALPVLDGENIRTREGKFKTDVVEVTIPGDGKVEYKAILDQGEPLLYSWSATGDVYYDFHAHEAEGNPDFFTRYAEGEGQTDSGSIVAPYQGQHGWFWLNLMAEEITVRLEVAGYYDEIIEIDLNAEY